MSNKPYSTEYNQTIGKWVNISDQLSFNNLSFGTGSLEAYMTRSGSTVTGYMVITLGSGFSIGSNPSFNLPFPMENLRQATSWSGSVFDLSTGDEYIISGYGITTSQIGFRMHEKGTTKNILLVPLTSIDPITFAIGDKITLSGTYKVASNF